MFNQILNNIILRNKIFRYIHDISLNIINNNNENKDYEYHDQQQQHIIVYKSLIIKKYHEIDNAGWMLDNHYYQLFRYKLLRGESIYFTTYALRLLFSKYSSNDMQLQLIKQLFNSDCLPLRLQNNQSHIMESASISGSIPLLNAKSSHVIYHVHGQTEGCTVIAFENAIKRDDYECLVFLFEWYHNRLDNFHLNNLFRCACNYARMDMVKFIYGKMTLPRIQWSQVLYSNNQLVQKKSADSKYSIADVFDWFHENNVPHCGPEAWLLAMEIGSLEALKIIMEKVKPDASRDHSYSLKLELIDMSVRSGSLQMIKYIYDNIKQSCTESAIVLAASNGYLAILEFIIDHHFDMIKTNNNADILTTITDLFKSGVKSGSLAILNKILYYIGKRYGGSDSGSENGHQTTIVVEQSLLEINPNLKKLMFVETLEAGHLEMFTYLLERYSPLMDQSTFNMTLTEILTRYDKSTLELLYQHQPTNFFDIVDDIPSFDTSSFATLDYFFNKCISKDKSKNLQANPKELFKSKTLSLLGIGMKKT
ncbi:hypothetical protein PPL_08793 [Heterostelium album PN500]|uniref:Ankyrin repeat-containing protein n=1 Tax=Heterostelium pallidum (strain ATCC 26659 / Pp 5 / PN500) TaxID=670386 RepID=D3BJR4_HETP5|nr:hypothetical protein PPL_08793 [Heterostelium album PN500]EFA78144.1 hypothetical protein PPL_08793 [Heterostelium album PN500]|eukprot:XP_020430270.1 hypothetical protein PPL_08793 [Heterostelium album PN500]